MLERRVRCSGKKNVPTPRTGNERVRSGETGVKDE